MWRVQNSGEESWPLGCYLQFTAGDQLSTVQRIPAPPLYPSATADLTVQMTSPSTPGIFQSKWRMITPVSYTHLDVYKRQALHRLSKLSLEIILKQKSSMRFLFFFQSDTVDVPTPNSAATVSYTHLDVYKRQIQGKQ